MYATLRRPSAATGAATGSPMPRTSAADREHLDAGQVRGPGAPEVRVSVVAGAPYRLDQRLQLSVRGAFPERAAEIRSSRREEAGEELSLGGQPGAGAGAAERRRDRRDHPDLAGPVAVAESRRHLAGVVGRQRLERERSIDPGHDLRQRHDLVHPPPVRGPHVHELDVAEDDVLVARPARHREIDSSLLPRRTTMLTLSGARPA